MNSKITQIDFNATSVKFYFDNLNPKELSKAERAGLMHGAKIIEQATKRNIIARFPNARSKKHGGAIIEGLYKKLVKSDKGEYFAMVSILGEPKKRKLQGSRATLLKYFERGTDIRYHLGRTDSQRTESRILRRKYGNDIFYGRNHSTGKIDAGKFGFFFRDAKIETKEIVFNAMRDRMTEKLEEAYAKAVAKSAIFK